MSMEKTLKEILDEILDEVEQELEEATTTTGVDGYQTPFAFGTNRKKDKKKEKETATQAGYTLAEGLVSPKSGHKYFQLTKDTPVKYIAGHSGLGLTSPGVLLKNIPGFIDGKKGAYLIDYHGALFYVDLKKELKYQLKEVEKFFNWYNKIKTMNELDSQNYWKRTNNHIYTIKEKLIKIAKTIQEIEKWKLLKNNLKIS